MDHVPSVADNDDLSPVEQRSRRSGHRITTLRTLASKPKKKVKSTPVARMTVPPRVPGTECILSSVDNRFDDRCQPVISWRKGGARRIAVVGGVIHQLPIRIGVVVDNLFHDQSCQRLSTRLGIESGLWYCRWFGADDL